MIFALSVRSILITLSAAFVTAACCCSDAAGFDEVQRFLERLESADRDGDAVAVARCYASDAVLHPPRGPAVRGRSAIRERYASGFRQFDLELTIEPAAKEARGGLIIVWGRTQGHFRYRDGRESALFAERFLMILERGRGGALQIAHLQWRKE